MPQQHERIRMLNDELRKNLASGCVVITPGVAALGSRAVARIVKTIAVYDDFCHANDPHEEHDFGAFEVETEGETKTNTKTVFFKIDDYDRSFSMLSPDPADPSVTRRVITIMLADEY